MRKPDATRLYRSGEEPTVEKLMALDDEVTALKEKLARLERDSSSSSKPPSSDGPAKPTLPPKPPSGRKPGGQPGHKGYSRVVLPPERVDQIVDHYPTNCERCRRSFRSQPRQEVADPQCLQQTEVPPVHAHVTEHRAHALGCSCGHVTCATMPAEVRASQFGPRLAALIAHLTVTLRIPRRGVRDFLQQLLGLAISTGSVQALIEEASAALADPVRELQEQLPKEPVINADETGWMKKRWLWIFVTTRFVFFNVIASRGAKALTAVLGADYGGIFCVDRWQAYTSFHKGRMQICWAHLKRDLLGLVLLGVVTKEPEPMLLGAALDLLRTELFGAWHQFRDGTISRARLQEITAPTVARFLSTLDRGRSAEHKAVRTLANGLWKRRNHLFTFLEIEGVEPTNNIAERGLRPAVQWRKICFGNRSDAGALATSRLLTTVHTCRLTQKDPLAFLEQCIKASRTGQPAPSLLVSAATG